MKRHICVRKSECLAYFAGLETRGEIVGPIIQWNEWGSVAYDFSGPIPNETESFGEEKTPNDAPDAHPHENRCCILAHWFLGGTCS